MPLYNFATYANCREEWAIRADSLEHARALLRNDPDGGWFANASRVDIDAVECRDEFVLDETDEHPAIEEITPDHWAWRAANRDWIGRSLHQNIAAISGDFHAHQLFSPFYDIFGKLICGFVGHYELSIAMAKALTEWEIAYGLDKAYENAGVTWIEVVEDFVETILELALRHERLPDPAKVLPTIQVLAHCRTSA